MYLCAIIDLHTRYVANYWGLSNTMTAQLRTSIVEEAVKQTPTKSRKCYPLLEFSEKWWQVSNYARKSRPFPNCAGSEKSDLA